MSEREEQAEIARAVAEALHHGDEVSDAEPHAAVLLRDGHGEEAERGAALPELAIEELLPIALAHVGGERASRELDGLGL